MDPSLLSFFGLLGAAVAAGMILLAGGFVAVMIYLTLTRYRR